ncbi:MAG: recombination mediator RecR [bacterium]|nr:recombination mediator RecR [bacterium]
MNQYPESIKLLIEKLSRWPGLGPKSAERTVFYLLKQNKENLDEIINGISNLSSDIKICDQCFNISTDNTCSTCNDKNRDQSIVCIVAEPQDVLVIEKTGEFNGLYHVLGGLITPAQSITPDQLKIKELIKRLEQNKIKEIILATNPDLEGETTAMYITDVLKNNPVKITRLAKGLPIGSTIEYADEITLSSALKGRQQVK